MSNGLTPEQREMVEIWDKHTSCEFETKDTEETMRTMTYEPHVNHVPVMTGGTGWKNVRDFYSTHFIPCQSPDTELVPVSRTVGSDRVVDELIFKFTHTVDMPWMLPGIPPTGKKVELAVVVVIGFKDGKISSEHIYWDQASVLVQIGLLNADNLPVAGVETARKVLDPALPSNELIKKFS
jgi:carboxymethylenebutenolidase